MKLSFIGINGCCYFDISLDLYVFFVNLLKVLKVHFGVLPAFMIWVIFSISFVFRLFGATLRLPEAKIVSKNGTVFIIKKTQFNWTNFYKSLLYKITPITIIIFDAILWQHMNFLITWRAYPNTTYDHNQLHRRK